MGLTGDIVKEYLTRFPQTPSKTLALKIYEENTEAFTTFDAVRSAVRYYRGRHGKKNKGSLQTDCHLSPAGRLYPFDELPEGIRCLSEAN